MLHRFGYLISGVKPRWFWFRLLSFAVNFFIALQSTLANQASLRVLLTSIIFAVNVVAVGVIWPFTKW